MHGTIVLDIYRISNWSLDAIMIIMLEFLTEPKPKLLDVVPTQLEGLREFRVMPSGESTVLYDDFSSEDDEIEVGTIRSISQQEKRNLVRDRSSASAKSSLVPTT
jgi:hypothetical protein